MKGNSMGKLLMDSSFPFVGAALAFACTLAVGGCYSWTTMRQAPPGSETVSRSSEARPGAVACIGDTRIEGDSEASLIALQEKLTTSAVFSDVLIVCGAHQAAVLNIVSAEHADQHIARMVFTSATFILYGLPTLIPYRCDYAENITVEAVCADGAARHYRSQADGSEYHTVWAGFEAPRRTVRSVVTERVVNDLVNQLARDRDFFAGG